MGQVSKRLISKEIADRIFDVFVKSFIKIRNVEDAQKLADDLFSPTERIMLAKRLAIAFDLMMRIIKVVSKRIKSIALKVLLRGMLKKLFQEILEYSSKNNKEYLIKIVQRV